METAPRPRERGNLPGFRELLEGPIDVRAVALPGLSVLATVYTLYFAHSFLFPVVLALLLSFLLAPLIRALKRVGIPEALGSALVMLTLVGGTLYGIYALSTPASAWIASAPESLRKIDDKIRTLRKPVQKVNQAA